MDAPTSPSQKPGTPEVILIVGTSPETDIERIFFERGEHDVKVCPGPERKHLCPLLETGHCPLFESADGVVYHLDLDRAQHRAILHHYREMAPALPIRAIVREQDTAEYPELLADIELWSHEPTVSDLDGFAAEVESAKHYT